MEYAYGMHIYRVSIIFLNLPEPILEKEKGKYAYENIVIHSSFLTTYVKC